MFSKNTKSQVVITVLLSNSDVIRGFAGNYKLEYAEIWKHTVGHSFHNLVDIVGTNNESKFVLTRKSKEPQYFEFIFKGSKTIWGAQVLPTNELIRALDCETDKILKVHLPKSHTVDNFKSYTDKSIDRINSDELKYEALAFPKVEQRLKILEAHKILEGKQQMLNLVLEMGAIGTWDYDFKINKIFADRTTCRIFGIDEEVGLHGNFKETFLKPIHPDDTLRVERMLIRSIKTGLPFNMEYRIFDYMKKMRWVSVSGFLIRDEQMNNVRFPGVIKDITEIKEASIQLELAQSTAKIGSWELNMETYELIWSKELYRIFEIPLHISKSKLYNVFTSKIHPDDMEEMDNRFERALKGNKSVNFLYRIIMSDGRIKYIHVIGKVKKDNFGSAVSLSGTGQDVTEQKQAELLLEQERLKNLRAQIDGEELEKKRISEEIHDGIGQILTAAKLTLATISASPKLDESLLEPLQQAKSLINEANIEAQRISKKLTPTSLKEYGLEKSLHILLEQLSVSAKINITLQCPLNLSDLILFEDKIIIYRIIQEALNNAIKYSKSTKIIVQFKLHGNKLKISITDYGIGFDPDMNANGLGMIHMKQRAYSVGANFNIDSTKGKGTSIELIYSSKKQNY